MLGCKILSLYFLNRHKGWRKSLWIGLLALAWGSLIGFVRIAQGGHFFTDVLWSAAIVWLISALLYYLMALHKEPLIIYETEAKALSPTQ